MAFSIFYLFPFILLCVLHSIWQLSMLVEPPLLQAETWSASISSIFQIRWRLASRNVDGLKPILDFFFGTLALSLADIDQELTFYAANDTLVLTVQQASFDSYGGTSMDQPFSTPTDQPGFSRRR
jgi:hypothetical protein